MMKSATVFQLCAVSLACSMLTGCFSRPGGLPSQPVDAARPEGTKKVDGMTGPWLSERKGIVIYPDNVANPRFRTVPNTPEGAKGRGMGLWETFMYPLAPLIRFEKGGSATFFLRDNLRRLEKTVLSFEDGEISLAVVIASASEGKTLKLQWRIDQNTVTTVDSGMTAGAAWTPFSLRWTATEAILEQDGKNVATVKIAAPFDPKRLSLNAFHIDELAVDGNGRFRLDWDLGPGYAAGGEAKSPSELATAQLHGFDAMVISQERTPRRDRPFVQACNASTA
ncbi:MAG: hypothetical protein U1E27_08010, partial [Kiritimatiellia bacterium]|nr:hypothetical protein [Kiritimatiellia bacterium]